MLVPILFAVSPFDATLSHPTKTAFIFPSLMHRFAVNHSIMSYVNNTDVKDIISDVEKGPNHLMSKLKEHQAEIYGDLNMKVQPKQQEKKQTVKPKPMGF